MKFFKKNNGEYVEYDDMAPKKKLMEVLIERTKVAGHQLSYAEAEKDPEMIQPNTYAFHYGGSFSKVAERAWSMIGE